MILVRCDVLHFVLKFSWCRVQVECSVGELDEALVSNHGIMVMTQGTREEAIKWNNFCRTQNPPISFVQVITSGVFGSVFVDHGDEFEIKDPDGKAPLVKLCSPQGKPYRAVISRLGLLVSHFVSEFCAVRQLSKWRMMMENTLCVLASLQMGKHLGLSLRTASCHSRMWKAAPLLRVCECCH